MDEAVEVEAKGGLAVFDEARQLDKSVNLIVQVIGEGDVGNIFARGCITNFEGIEGIGSIPLHQVNRNPKPHGAITGFHVSFIIDMGNTQTYRVVIPGLAVIFKIETPTGGE